jgi:hypothetical protein
MQALYIHVCFVMLHGNWPLQVNVTLSEALYTPSSALKEYDIDNGGWLALFVMLTSSVSELDTVLGGLPVSQDTRTEFTKPSSVNAPTTTKSHRTLAALIVSRARAPKGCGVH